MAERTPNKATICVVNDRSRRQTTEHKIQWRIDCVMNEPWVRDILQDDSLDR